MVWCATPTTRQGIVGISCIALPDTRQNTNNDAPHTNDKLTHNELPDNKLADNEATRHTGTLTTRQSPTRLPPPTTASYSLLLYVMLFLCYCYVFKLSYPIIAGEALSAIYPPPPARSLSVCLICPARLYHNDAFAAAAHPLPLAP